MWQNAHDSYLESRVLAADPIELVRMLYREAVRAVGTARRHLAAGDIAARSRAITQSSAAVIELATSLDHERGGEISANLARLYDYMLRRLNEANLQQIDGPLGDVLGLLTTMSEGWEGIQAQGTVAPVKREDSAPQAAASKPAAVSAGSWEQPGRDTPATYGSSWSQPAAQDSPVTYGNSRAQPATPEPVASYGDAWGQALSPEPLAAVAKPWAAPAAHDLAAAYGTWAQPAAPETAAPEAASVYGSSWAPVPSEPSTSYSPHDWTL